MKNTIIIILLLINSTQLFGQQHYIIEGRTNPELDRKPVMLFTFKQNKINSVDTTYISNGIFRFEGDTNLEELSILTSGNYPDTVRTVDLVLESGTIQVNLDTVSFISGTPLNDKWQHFWTCSNAKAELIKKIEAAKLANQSSEEYEMELGKLKNENPDMIAFTKNNISNVLGKELFRKYCLYMLYEEFFEIYALADPQLKTEPLITQALNQYQRRKAEHEQINKNTIVGTQYKDFSLLTIDGKETKLSDYIGKSNYVLIDFWASWCGPCIAEIPNIKRVYDKYKDKGLEVISISIDQQKKPWIDALGKVDQNWIQLLCPKADIKSLQDAYNFRGIPFLILINKKGIIENINLRGDFLDQLMQITIR